jgi:hypothetical protein
MEERHSALNITERLENVFADWEIKDKLTTVIISVITDNAKNVVNVSKLIYDVVQQIIIFQM